MHQMVCGRFYGVYLKIVIADNCAVFVNEIFANYSDIVQHYF